MKILCFSDLHISNRNPKYKLTDGISDLLLRQDLFIEQICEYTIENKIDDIIFLGDWTDYPNLDPITLYYSNKMITKLAETKAQIFLLEGNHCLSFKSNNFSVLDASSQAFEQENIHFINQPLVHKRDDGLSYYFVPYNSNKEKMIEDIKEMNVAAKKDLTNVCFFHFPTMNALYDSGLKSTSGIELRQEYISNFDITLGGDFHKAQKLIGTKNAHYVGAPFCLTYSDDNLNRGFMEYCPDNKKQKHIQNKHLIEIHKMDNKQILDSLTEDCSNMIIKLTEEITLEQKLNIENSKLAKTAYKIDYSFIKKDSKEDEKKVDSMEVMSKHNDVEYVESYLKKNKSNNVEDILNIFIEVKSKVENN
jgi:DNA repair exonuclease SbcCD nuclease subunit